MTPKFFDEVLVAGPAFVRNVVGLLTRPYETFRRIVDRGNPVELLYIALLGALYFAIASLVKEASFRPFLLTKQFVVLSGTATASFLLVGTTLWIIGSNIGGKGTFSRFLLAWGYTLLPTIAWFFVTSLLYVLLPPPRTTRITGITFSIVYLTFSSMLLFWKIVLGYLSLRFGMRFGLGKILLVAAIAVPVFAFYSFGMYRLGVFKVPFI